MEARPVDEEVSKLKKRSYAMTGKPGTDSWVRRVGARGFSWMSGWDRSDFSRPVITVAAPFAGEANICNQHFQLLVDTIVDEVVKLGGRPYVCFPPVITDGMAMGCEGMKYSLPSRDMCANHIELMHEGYHADGLITLGGCDKTQPGCLMPIPRGNHIGITLYGGGRLPGSTNGKCPGWEKHFGSQALSAGSAFEAQGAFSNGTIDIEELEYVEQHCLGSVGSCGEMFTASTMAAMFEAMGMALPGSSSTPAMAAPGVGLDPAKVHQGKHEDCRASVRALFGLLKAETHSRSILTKEAFENGITALYALGGSTNAVLHLLALAREADVDLTVDDFNRIGDRVPLISKLKPHGSYSYSKHLHDMGGLPVVLRLLLEAGLLHGDPLTVTGKTMRENLLSAPPLPEGQDVIVPIDSPVAPPGVWPAAGGASVA